jgi:hypothetical protein
LGLGEVGGGDVPGDGQAQRIDQEVTFSAFSELAAVIAADAPAIPRRFSCSGCP